AGREAVLEQLRAVVPKQDAEHLEVDDALEQLADAFEQIVEIENAGDLAGDLIENGQRLRLTGDTRVQSRIFDGNGHAGGNQFEQPLMFGSEVAQSLGLDVENADDLIFDDQRNR